MKVETKADKMQQLVEQLAVNRVLMANAETYDDMISAYDSSIKILKKLKKLEESK